MENSPCLIKALLLNEQTLAKLEAFYSDKRLPSPNPYIQFFAKTEDGVSVSVYSKAHSGAHKVVFQGNGSQEEASIWSNYSDQPSLFEPSSLAPKQRKDAYQNLYPQIGSDEVGTGDLFGPVCVVGAYVKKEDLPMLEDLGVTDSKKLTDEKVKVIATTLIKKIPYSSLSLPLEKYNELYNKGENLNSIKAKMHNRCLLNLSKKYPNSHIYQDQFAEASLYYSYLSKETEVQKGIIFKTKGELAFPSVACASIIARYSFLQKMDAISKAYSFLFPFGSGEQAKEALLEFVSAFGEGELPKVAKMNFKTIKETLDTSK